jgi:hypothetical protein
VPTTVLDTAFLHRDIRKVANDGTIKLAGKQYETGRATIGASVTVRYQPDLSKVYLEWEESLSEIHLVNKVDNAHVKREQVRMAED